MSTKSIELEKRSSINVIYPQEYLNGFNRPDEVVVEEFYKFISERGDKVRAIVISPTGRNETETVLYIVSYEGNESCSSDEINWAAPGRTPNKYPTYGRGDTMFHLLSGNLEIQTRRALMLAKKLDCFVGQIPRTRFEKTGIQFMGTGAILGQRASNIIFADIEPEIVRLKLF